MPLDCLLAGVVVAALVAYPPDGVLGTTDVLFSIICETGLHEAVCIAAVELVLLAANSPFTMRAKKTASQASRKHLSRVVQMEMLAICYFTWCKVLHNTHQTREEFAV